MKNSKLIIASIALLGILSCSEDDHCLYNTADQEAPLTCVPFPPNEENASFMINTAYQDPDNPTDWIGGIYDTRLNSQAPIGADWGTAASPVPLQRPTNWKVNELGQIFGIAIDGEENIFLATSDVYADPANTSPFPSSSAQQAQIYKCVAPSYIATPFLAFTTGTDLHNDLGNIAYDKVNDQLFASVLEDGTITRISGLASSSGTIDEVYDPWSPDASGAGTIAPSDEQVWAVGVNYEAGVVKVYFPRVSATERSIYSITLVNGAFPAGGATLEISNLAGSMEKLTDIAFSSNGREMLIAEKGNPHLAQVFSYTLSGGVWTFNQIYEVGGFSGDNAGGGVDFAYKEIDGDINAECDSFFWATGNFLGAVNELPNRIYGMEGIMYSGNLPESNPAGNHTTDIFIDNNQDLSSFEKYAQGDVEVFDCDNCFDLCDFE